MREREGKREKEGLQSGGMRGRKARSKQEEEERKGEVQEK